MIDYMLYNDYNEEGKRSQFHASMPCSAQYIK